jgi:hypothetical protein
VNDLDYPSVLPVIKEAVPDLVLLEDNDLRKEDLAVWELYDEFMDGLLRGTPVPGRVCMGRWKGLPAVVGRIAGDPEDEHMDFEFASSAGRILDVADQIVTFEESPEGNWQTVNDGYFWGYYFEGSGYFDLFSSTLPSEHLESLHRKLKHWDDGTEVWMDFIREEIEAVKNIADPATRKIFEDFFAGKL